MPDSERPIDQTASPPAVDKQGDRTRPLRVHIGASSHLGKVRTNNEDQYAVIRRRRSREALMTSLPSDAFFEAEEEAYILIVADGMG